MKLTLLGARELELVGEIPLDANKDTLIVLKISPEKVEEPIPQGEEAVEKVIKVRVVDHIAMVFEVPKNND